MAKSGKSSSGGKGKGQTGKGGTTKSGPNWPSKTGRPSGGGRDNSPPKK